jgi:2,3-bisphosphoglycerate-dependent phosphoglycerate mutase|tara:strand:- start:1867 stop:2598 length:732 start_codon:yes stop_codon:yes gene_type:complete
MDFMSKLLLVRHGQSIWNSENRFTGWVDVQLSKQGENEALKSGILLKKLNINLDFFYTSYLKRATNTLEIILKEMGLEKQAYIKAWELNERHYGSLTGLNKEEVKKNLGDKLFKKYRRSWDVAPPPQDQNSENKKLYSPLNKNIDQILVPSTESLKDTFNRVVPYFDKQIKPHLINNKNIIIAAHGNSLRALCKKLFNISDQKINELEIPTGNPLIIEFDQKLKIKDISYLDKTREKTIITNQ